MTKLRLGYIGCGYMAQKVHIPNIVAIDACELVAIAEVRPKLGRMVQERYGIPKLYQSHRELARDRDIDAVALSGHYAVQGDIAIDLLNAGKDVFMEKPMAISVEQAERILAAEKSSGKRVMVAYMKRYDPGNIRVKELIDQAVAAKDLGQIRYVRNHGFGGDWTGGLDTPFDQSDEKYPDCAFTWPGWLPEKNRQGYIDYLQQYTHNINLVRWFLGSTGGVTVKAAELGANGVHGVVVLDVGGVPVTIESGWLDYEGWDEHTQVFFDKGWVRTEAPPLLLKNVPATIEVYRADQAEKSATKLFPKGGRNWSYREEMRHFVACVANGAPFRSPASDTIEDVRVLEDIYKHFIAARSAPAQAQSRASAR
ncbi:MAG: Gfo/Idh/MocA family oxidoreductase [Planctomycetes bacterium]|nr:Gfo/Idh/MocA family oxidoreductase [Planctomycetota bacterium]